MAYPITIILACAGVAAQPLVNTVQTNNMQSSAQASNNVQSSGAAAADPSSGVVSGKTYQSGSQASPLTPYNQVRLAQSPCASCCASGSL